MTKIVIRVKDVCADYSREEARELVEHLEDVGWEEFAPMKTYQDENEENTIRELYLKRDFDE